MKGGRKENGERKRIEMARQRDGEIERQKRELKKRKNDKKKNKTYIFIYGLREME